MKPSDYIARGWCQDMIAKDATGQRVPATDTTAIQWCVMGAIRVAYNDLGAIAARRAETALCKHLGLEVDWDELGGWNDVHTRTQEEVLAALKACNL